LEKRTKKLLDVGTSAGQARDSNERVFCFFFQKYVLSSLALHSATVLPMSDTAADTADTMPD
jgi:hypothetical protein